MKYIVFIIVILCYINIGDASIDTNKQITLQPSFSDKVKASFLQSNDVLKRKKEWYEQDVKALGEGNDAIRLIKKLSKVDPAVQIKYFLMSFLTNEKHKIETNRMDYNRRAISRLMLFALSGLLTSRKYGKDADNYKHIQGLIAERFKQHARCLIDKSGNLDQHDEKTFRGDGTQETQKVIDESIDPDHLEKYSWRKFGANLNDKQKLSGIRHTIDQTLQCIALCGLKKKKFDELINSKSKKKKSKNNKCFKTVCCQNDDLIEVDGVKYCKTQALAAKQVRANMVHLYKTYDREKLFPHQVVNGLTFDEESSLSDNINNMLRNHERSPCNSIQEMFRFFKTWEGAKNTLDNDRKKGYERILNRIKRIAIVAIGVITTAVVTGLTIAASVATMGAAAAVLPFVLPVASIIGTSVATGTLNLVELGINKYVTRQFNKRNEKRNERISLQTLGISLLEGSPFDTTDNKELQSNDAETSIGSITQTNKQGIQLTKQQKEMEQYKQMLEANARQVALRLKLLYNRYDRKMGKYKKLEQSKFKSLKIQKLKEDHNKALGATIKYSILKLKLKLKEKTNTKQVAEILKFVSNVLEKNEEQCEHRIDNTFKFFKWMFEDPEKWKEKHKETFAEYDELSKKLEGKDWGEMMRNSIGLRATNAIMDKTKEVSGSVTDVSFLHMAPKGAPTCPCPDTNPADPPPAEL